MTCTSIVHFNFPLKSDIKLNSLEQETFLNSKNNILSTTTNHHHHFEVDEENPELTSIKILQHHKASFLNRENSVHRNHINGKEAILNESINTEAGNTKVNMNNGLSNGHDLNLEFGLATSGSLLSPFDSPSSFSTELSHANFCVNPVSSSSSCTDQNILLTTGDSTMGLLSNNSSSSDKDDFLGRLKANNKIQENGPSLLLDPDPQWNSGVTKINNIGNTNSLPHHFMNKNTYSKGNSFLTSTSTTTTTTNQETINLNSDNIVSSKALRTDGNNLLNIGRSFLINSNFNNNNIKNEIPETLSLVHNCDAKQQQQQQPPQPRFLDSRLNYSLKEQNCSDVFLSDSLLSDQKYGLTPINKTCESDPVPKEDSLCNDLLSKQQTLLDHHEDLERRIRRLQVQYTHKNQTKQMRRFVSRQQKLNSIKCQRLDSDFSYFINDLSETCSSATQIDQKFNPLDCFQRNSTSNDVQKFSASFGNSSLKTSFTNCPPQTPTSGLNNDFLKPSTSASTLTDHFGFNRTEPILLHHHHLQNNNNNNSSYDSLSDVKNEYDLIQPQIKQEQQQHAFNHVSNRTLSQESQNILTTIDSLRFNLRHVESKYDSDATDSSSGGESCDEFDEIDNCSTTYSTLPSHASTPSSTRHRTLKRNSLSWKWHTERRAIASRWSWLLAQITDLETKLRQQNELFRHLRASKGSISFGDNGIVERQFPSFSSINNTMNQSNGSNQPTQQGLSSTGNNSNLSMSSLNTSSFNNSSSSSIPAECNQKDQQHHNNTVNNINNNNNSENSSSSNSKMDEDYQCMRTKPFISMKQRKLLWSENSLSVAAKKAVKYSSIRCSCNIYPTHVPPCVICNGRYNYMHSIDTEFMPYYERVSLLDSSCHPTLCLPREVPLDLHFKHFLKRETLNNKISLTKNIKKKKINSTHQLSNEQKLGKKSSAFLNTSKSKKKLLKKKKRRSSTDSLRKNAKDRLSSGCSSRADSPVPSPTGSDSSSNGASVSTPTSATSAPLSRRRKSEQQIFDINNIVIPYSVAATTRVERLQYKEIITPKWRLVEEYSIPPPENIKQEMMNNGKNLNNNHAAISEDISDNVFEVRHSKCEQNERQRIMTYYSNKKNQNVKRKGSRVRFESKCDSMDQTSQDSFNSNSKIKSKANAHNNDYERKRQSTIMKSLSKEDDEEPHVSVAPYETRKFPLPDWLYENMLQETFDQKEEEERRCRRSTKLSSMDDFDMLDDSNTEGPRLSSSASVMDINEDETLKDVIFRDDDDAVFQENDDPEWKPDL